MAQIAGAPDLTEIQPLIPPGISDFNLELYGRKAYTWKQPDGTKIVEVLGSFSARLGGYKLSANDAILWVRQATWEKRPYLLIDVFLWRDAGVLQPGGTVETGPTLMVSLRTFGGLSLNVDAHAGQSDADGDLFQEASKARKLLSTSPAEIDKATGPVELAGKQGVALLARPKPRKQVDFSVGRPDGRLVHEQLGDQPVIVATYDVSISQGTPSESGEFVEIRADAAVLFLNKEKASGPLGDMMGDEQNEKKGASKNDLSAVPAQPSQKTEPKLQGREKSDRDAARDWVKSVYLEGDVVLTRGERMIRAAKLYYDFENDKALILDAVMRGLEPTQKVPVYVRAEKVRQLAATEYVAEKAQFTTSEFHTPHVSIGAEKLELTDRTPRDEAGNITGIQAGTYKAYNTTLNLEGLPIAYWPFSRGDFSADRQAFRSAKVGYNGDFGWSVETRWYLFNLMGLEPPKGFDATLKLDYFTDRGPGVGIDMDYQQDNYFGLVRTYYIHDTGKDEIGPERSGEPPHENRGRALWRHRQLLPKGWELSLEASYLSDTNFLEQFERNEFENGKDQETLAYLVKRKDNWQFNSLLNYRINEFQTQTEHMPDTQFNLIGEPLGEIATLYSDSRMGVVRYRYDSDSSFGLPLNNPNAYESTGSVLRGDTREEVRVPLPELGPLKLNPYAAGRVTGWDDSPETIRRKDRGGFGRAFGSYGIEGNLYASKVDHSIESELLDLHHLRHIIKPDFTVFNAHANEDPMDLTPFDGGVEDIADFGGGTMGVRQQFQTKRGGAGQWRTVDWIVLDLEAGFFNNKQKGENTHGDYIFSRPEDSLSSNFLAGSLQYRISDSTVVVYDGVYDANNGNMGTSDVTLAVEREPRMAYFVGWRYIHDTESNIVAAGGNYKLSEKHTVGMREMYDIEEGRNLSTEFVYVKKWPRFYTAITLDIDKALDDAGVNFSIWPEGAPRLGLGSKRYTGLADSVGVQPR